MTETPDPLDALREPLLPVDPDPAFAGALRARLVRALLHPEGATMTTTDQNTDPATVPAEGDVGYASLWLPDLVRGQAFYTSVLGWEYQPGNSRRHRQIAGLPGQHIGMAGGIEHNTTLLSFAVEDARETVRRIRAAGGSAEDPVTQPYGFAAMCTDDQDLTFAIHQSPAAQRGPRAQAGPGEIGYLVFEALDSARFKEFFGAVFGWRFSPGPRGGDRWSVEGAWPLAGLTGGNVVSTVVPQFVVADIDAAVAQVRAAGGSSTDPQRQPYGVSADCVDDQGGRFYLVQL